jgi:hypothetical protein
MWGSGGVAPPFFTSALDGGEWSASRPGRYTHWIRGWVGPRAGLDDVEKRILSCPCRESNPGSPTRRYTNQGIPARTVSNGKIINKRLNEKGVEESGWPVSRHQKASYWRD